MRKVFFKNLKALSLVEILVVLGLFSSIAIFSLAALFNTQAINTKLTASQEVLDNINLSLQSMTRDIRYGASFRCEISTSIVATTTKSCPFSQGNGGSVLIFMPIERGNDDDRVLYYVSNGILYKEERFKNKATTTYQITSGDVYIDHFKIFVQGANSSNGCSDDPKLVFDHIQPLISLFVSGKTKQPNKGQISVPFNIETHVSSRTLDLVTYPCSQP